MVTYGLLAGWISVISVALAEESKTYSFDERQEQLVAMAGVLGGMHHLHQVCFPEDYLPDRFRDRMTELVTLESPFVPTRELMIAAFNEGYQSRRGAFEFCTFEADEEMRRLARQGEDVVAQLAAPFDAIMAKDPLNVSED